MEEAQEVVAPPSTGGALCCWAGARTGFKGHSTLWSTALQRQGIPSPHFHLSEGDFLGSSTAMSVSTPAVGQPRTEAPRGDWRIPPVLTSPVE